MIKTRQETSSDGNTKVVYMKYAQASKLLDVLNGISEGFIMRKKQNNLINGIRDL